MFIESTTPPMKIGRWSIVSQKPDGGLRTSQEKGSAVPCSHMGLQKAQKLQDAKGHFLSSSMHSLILMQEVEESTGSTLDPKRVGEGKLQNEVWIKR